jgi:phosphoribosylanthranilate isomerase
MTPPLVKVCCIESLAEARLAMAYGAGAIGLVSAMPSGPGVIDEARIAEIAGAVEGMRTFLLTSLTDPEAIIAQHGRLGTTTLQLVDEVSNDGLERLRTALPTVGLVQVIHVTGHASIAQAQVVAPLVDAILLDSGRPQATIKQLGGTGRVHDWTVSRRIRDDVAIPLYLAGGLRPDNVTRAWQAVQPAAVDVCSGVRTDGRLDEAKLGRFISAVEAAAREGGGQGIGGTNARGPASAAPDLTT